MKKEIHPEYMDCEIVCGCGQVIHTRGTVARMAVEICSSCHPFYTGKQKFVDTAGRVEKFRSRYNWGVKDEEPAEEESAEETAAEAGEAAEAEASTDAAGEAVAETDASSDAETSAETSAESETAESASEAVTSSAPFK